MTSSHHLEYRDVREIEIKTLFNGDQAMLLEVYVCIPVGFHFVVLDLFTFSLTHFIYLSLLLFFESSGYE